MPEGDDEYYVPLVDQKVFGAGVKRRRIDFVPASNAEASSTQDISTKPSLANKYLSIVLPKDTSSSESTPRRTPEVDQDGKLGITLCAICKQPLSTSKDKVAINSHESSIAHQVCLTHSHPPSHLDREHVGLRYLQEYGWDPDSRTGLGSRQEGIRVPIKAKEKHDTTGLRELNDEEDNKLKKKTRPKKDEPVVLLDAGKVRKQELEAKRRAEKLRSSFYGPDLSQYLGPDG